MPTVLLLTACASVDVVVHVAEEPSASANWHVPGDGGDMFLPPMFKDIDEPLHVGRAGDGGWSIPALPRTRALTAFGFHHLQDIAISFSGDAPAAVRVIPPDGELFTFPGRAPYEVERDGSKVSVDAFFGYSAEAYLPVLDAGVRHVDLTLHRHRPLPETDSAVSVEGSGELRITLTSAICADPCERGYSTRPWDLAADPLALEAYAMSEAAWTDRKFACSSSPGPGWTCLVVREDLALLAARGVRSTLVVESVERGETLQPTWATSVDGKVVRMVAASRPGDALAWVSAAITREEAP